MSAGLATRDARGLRLASDALVTAARPGMPRPRADHTLSTIYAAHGQAALALAHRISAGDAEPSEADPLLPNLDPRDPAARVLMEVLCDAAPAVAAATPPAATQGAPRPWPTDASTALVAANLADRLGNLEAAIDLHKQAMRLAQREDSPELLARAALGLGRLESRAARYPLALEAFRAALPGPEAPTEDHRPLGPELEVLVLSGLARAAALSGELEVAQSAAERGLALADGPTAGPPGAPRPAAEAGLLYTRALVDWYRGRLDEAEPRLTRALEAARAHPVPSEDGRQRGASPGVDAGDEAAITTALGLVAHRRGDHARAARHYSEALRLGEAARDEARVLTVLQNQAVLQHERGEWTEALDTYRHALSLAEGLDARARIAQLAGNLGNLWRYLGETDRAETVLERGLAIARADKNRHLDAVITNLLGDVASDRGDLAKAEALFREAVAIAKDAQCRPEAIEASVNLARVLIERFDIRAAREVAEETLTATEAEGQRPMQIVSLALLATIERRSSHEPARGTTPSDPRARVDAKTARQATPGALMESALAGIEALKNADARWPIYLEAALAARDRDDLSAAENWAREVRKVLQGQLDQVPAAHRERFRARRDRRDAYRETASLVSLTNSASRPDDKSARALGWTRLLEVHKRLAQEHNVQRLLEYILDSAILLTGAERGFLLLDDEGHKEGLEVKVARNLDQENIRNKHMKISRGIARRVIATGEAVVTVDAMEDERYREQLSVVDLRLRSILCLPMAFRGKVLGAIYLDNRFRASAFADEDLRFMEAFADMAAIALDNARLVESLEAQKKATDTAKREVESLASRLETELERRTRELEDTRIMMIAERRQLAEHRFDDIIGTSAPMRRVFQMIERLRNTDIAVLVEGESGTGKELVARAIHFSGARRERPFVAVNCGAIPASLLESELFGHIRGAFTNATSDKKGLFEVAHTGTLFLDEIGEMPLEMQVKLLRVLQSGDIQKVGAVKQVTVDVRIVTATNRKLDEEVAAGRFREDLFYRLSVVPIVVPPLRERRDDIPLLVQHFIEANKKSGLGQVQSISKDALALLQRYAWPGNVRQLETVMKNASVFCDGTVLYPQDFTSFPDIVGGGGGPGGTTPNDKTDATSLSLSGRTLADLERLAIVQALKDNKGNKKKTAEQLGIDRRTLYNKLASYGIAIESDLKVT
ncbi:MAG: sigma 54-interacting transcriptional regulator [Deltaproteobacteria bacterium]|nr:sigma 54-interacting transcriptional regulator [Deltaproteobacteria bacterium]